MIKHLLKRTQNPDLLYASPFTDIAPSVPEQVLTILSARTSFVHAIERLNASAVG